MLLIESHIKHNALTDIYVCQAREISHFQDGTTKKQNAIIERSIYI